MIYRPIGSSLTFFQPPSVYLSGLAFVWVCFTSAADPDQHPAHLLLPGLRRPPNQVQLRLRVRVLLQAAAT